MADAVRMLSVEMIQTANSGHPGAALGFADVITVLYANHLRFNPAVGDWAARDRMILSMGHASAMLYAVLHLAGYPISRDDLLRFRKVGGLPGHPERDLKHGIEMTTGPLGQGFASAVGVAMANPKSKLYVLAGDGDLMEGVTMEAASFAGTQNLKNLIVMWDDNNITIDGPAATRDNTINKFRSMGWDTIEVDGHNPRKIDKALRIARRRRAPVLIACKTKIGKGSVWEGTSKVHGSPLPYDDAMRMISELTPNFEVAAPLWEKLRKSRIENRESKNTAIVSEKREIIKTFSMPKHDANKPMSTRAMFKDLMTEVIKSNPDLIIGGSADVGESSGAVMDAPRYIHYGIREHAMGAVMNGLAMSGLYPHGSTFLAFSDYMRPAMRQAAMMNLPVLFVFSHDSIALGEDGPTHQPIEQLPGLRLIPNMRVYRPANMLEMYLCMKHHFESSGPAALILTRQAFSRVPDSKNTAADAYLLSGVGTAEIRLCATGSEVALALEVQEKLKDAGIKSSVISMPVLSKPDGDKFNVFIEASAERPCWADMVFNITHFGESGPGMQVYYRNGFDADKIAKAILSKIK